MNAPVTTLYAIPLALMFLALSIQVIWSRRSQKIAYGDGGDKDVAARIRAQSNWVEYVPIVVLLMALAEGGGASPIALHLCGIVLVLGRAIHGYAMGFNRSFFQGRVYGTALTLVALMLAIGLAAISLF